MNGIMTSFLSIGLNLCTWRRRRGGGRGAREVVEGGLRRGRGQGIGRRGAGVAGTVGEGKEGEKGVVFGLVWRRRSS